MAIIFGWGGGSPKDRGPVVPLMCPNCGNNVFYRYISSTKWFRLYFIPLIPYSTKHFLLCPVCSRGMELMGSNIGRAGEMAGRTQHWQQGLLPEDEYVLRVREFWEAMLPQGEAQSFPQKSVLSLPLPPPPP